MKYLYYPGCSLEGTAREYDLSTRAFMEAAGVELLEVPDWTCCGSSAAETVSRRLPLALSARNLALAEQIGGGLDLLVPCSACYLNLKKAEEAVLHNEKDREEINEILGEVGLSCKGGVRVRHLLDVLATDLGGARLAELVKQPLTGLTVAPYYGCQCLRPYAEFDDPEAPTSMEPLIRAAGAEVLDWGLAARCCGASNVTTKPEAGLELVADILEAAQGADAVVTVCPMCQLNLEANQKQASRLRGRDLSVTILYLPQLLGLALGLTEKEVRMDLNLAVLDTFRRRNG